MILLHQKHQLRGQCVCVQDEKKTPRNKIQNLINLLSFSLILFIYLYLSAEKNILKFVNEALGVKIGFFYFFFFLVSNEHPREVFSAGPRFFYLIFFSSFNSGASKQRVHYALCGSYFELLLGNDTGIINSYVKLIRCIYEIWYKMQWVDCNVRPDWDGMLKFR